jgi:predicted MPP superfamily phosphohydrolase
MAHKIKPRRGLWRWGIALAMLLLLGYGFIIEPRWLVVTQLQKQVGLKGATFKIAQLSDLHLSAMGPVEEATLNVFAFCVMPIKMIVMNTILIRTGCRGR